MDENNCTVVLWYCVITWMLSQDRLTLLLPDNKFTIIELQHNYMPLATTTNLHQ